MATRKADKCRNISSGIEFVSSNAPFRTTEGQRYGKRPINLNQPIKFIADETACYFGKHLLEYQFDQDTNSLLVIMTCGLKVRLWFKKENNHDNQTES